MNNEWGLYDNEWVCMMMSGACMIMNDSRVSVALLAALHLHVLFGLQDSHFGQSRLVFFLLASFL